MAKHLAARDIKFGTVDGVQLIAAGTELTEDQIRNLPPGSFRTIDETTFPDGRCPTCGSVIATSIGQPGNVPSEGTNREDAPGSQRDAPQGDAARQEAIDSKKSRPDNADSGMPSWGKIPIDVERSFVQNRQTMDRAASAPGPGRAPLMPPDPRTLANDPNARKAAANAAPKPGDQNMTQGFGNAEGTDQTGGTAATATQPQAGGNAPAAPAPPQQEAAKGGNRGGASKP